MGLCSDGPYTAPVCRATFRRKFAHCFAPARHCGELLDRRGKRLPLVHDVGRQDFGLAIAGVEHQQAFGIFAVIVAPPLVAFFGHHRII